MIDIVCARDLSFFAHRYIYMRHIVICFFALGISSSSAADLKRARPAHDAYEPPPSYQPVPTFAQPQFTWAGAYTGARIGYNFNNEKGTKSGAGTLDQFSISPQGLSGGVYAGYNMVAAQFLYGLELGTDYSFARQNGQAGSTQIDAKMNYQFSLIGRLGYALDHYLIYGLGGGAFAHDRIAYSATSASLVNNQHRLGWVVGGGTEYAFNPNWSTRAEYRYSQFQNDTDHFSAGTVGPFTLNNSILRTLHEQKVSVGLNYKFNP